MGATATDRFSRREFLRLLDITDKQLTYWEKLGIVSPRKAAGEDFYDFRDLISLRTAKQLIQSGVSAPRLRLALSALNQKLSKVQTPLTELRILSNGRDVIVDHEGAHLEPISGQFVLNFDTRELRDKVRVMPERNVTEWFALALQYESDPDTHFQAIEAYRRVLAVNPTHIEAVINLGMLSYEQGDLESASACFLRAVTGDPDNAVAHFNLGSVLDELGHLEAARRHLRIAVRIDSSYPDAHYNLAFVCDKLGSAFEARQHWQHYIRLDPTSPWCDYARQRLALPLP
jgi:tetratricopeptide (TPR) repeat protein